MMDYVDEPTEASDSASTAQTGDDPGSTGDDPALLKLVRKLEVCDAVEDAEERRKFVAKHANSVGMSVDDVLWRLHARGTLSAEEVPGKTFAHARLALCVRHNACTRRCATGTAKTRSSSSCPCLMCRLRSCGQQLRCKTCRSPPCTRWPLPQLSLPPQPQRSLPPHSPRSRPRPNPRHRPSPSPKPNQVPVGGGEKLRALLAARDLTRCGPHPRPDRSPVGLSLSLTRTQTLSEPFPYAWP